MSNTTFSTVSPALRAMDLGGSEYAIAHSAVLVEKEETKELAAAGNYAANDVLSEDAAAGTAWTFSDIVGADGGKGYITKVQAICEETAPVMRTTLYLFKATPTCNLNDNVANTAVLAADRSNFVGKVDLPALESLGGCAEAGATPSTTGNLPLAFSCASNANDLYGVLVTRDAETNEVADMEMTVRITVEQCGC